MSDKCKLNVRCLLPKESAGFPYVRTFAEAWVSSGGAFQKNVFIPRRIRSCLGHVGADFRFWPTGRKMLCLGGGRIESVAWPWCYMYEIIPVMWDVWPEYVEPLCKFIRRNRVRLVFCTSRQQTELLRKRNPGVKVEWIPEGVDVGRYPCGEPLKVRPVDVLEYGRRLEPLHLNLLQVFSATNFKLLYQKGPQHLFSRFEDLTAGIRQAKIAICYPQCDTNPTRAGGVETLTQRYWECMLSGTLMCGRAPKELVELCGYDPVIPVVNASADQVVEVLNDLEKWQSLADRNRETAEGVAGWDKRMPAVIRAVEELR